MNTCSCRCLQNRQSERGAALILMLVILVLGAVSYLLVHADTTATQLARQKKTEDALSQAKEALIGYALSVSLSGAARLGDLPCPDVSNSGTKGTSCGNATGTTGQASRLGRLPWKDLGLPDLRDGDGERLWYAVSTNFKENTRSVVLNSDTMGTITVRDTNGNTLYDGALSTGVIAVIIAPGAPLIRQGSSTVQARATTAEQNTPSNYLDVYHVGSLTEDNADFVDGDPDGFIAGPISDPTDSSRLIVNDRLVVITWADLIPKLQTRVLREAMNCMTNYAAFSSGSFDNEGRYPWAAPLDQSAVGNYDDKSGTVFGRIPDYLENTHDDAPNMLKTWGLIPNCHITDSWFTNWREQVFYAVADAYKPGSAHGGPCGTGTCLSVVSSSSPTAPNQQVAIIVAGRTLSGQQRATPAEKGSVANYLEGENATPGDHVLQSDTSTTSFNDVVIRK